MKQASKQSNSGIETVTVSLSPATSGNITMSITQTTWPKIHCQTWSTLERRQQQDTTPQQQYPEFGQIASQGKHCCLNHFHLL
jgi:hypothetical protein